MWCSSDDSQRNHPSLTPRWQLRGWTEWSQTQRTHVQYLSHFCMIDNPVEFPAAYAIMTQNLYWHLPFFPPYLPLCVVKGSPHVCVGKRPQCAVLCKHNIWPCVGVSLKGKAVQKKPCWWKRGGKKQTATWSKSIRWSVVCRINMRCTQLLFAG